MQIQILNTTQNCIKPFNLSNTSVLKLHYEHQGFTLVELMISLVLGMLISAAAVQIYLTNARTSTVQKSGSELQDASVFGLQLLESHLRLANLGNSETSINDTTPNGGIVLSAANLTTAPAYFTNSTGDNVASASNGWTGDSNTNIGSDQLTIQFQNVTMTPMSDCEGTDVAVNATVIERYFLRRASNSNELVMACDAGRVAGSVITGFGGAGQEFISNVDQFKVSLITQDAAGLKTYISPHDYKSLSNPKSSVTAVKIGMIVRGSTATVGTTGQSNFSILGTTNTLGSGASTNVIRNTYESTTLLRNARPATS